MADEVRRLRQQTEVVPDGGRVRRWSRCPAGYRTPPRPHRQSRQHQRKSTTAVLPPVETPPPETAEEDEGEVILQSAVAGPGPVLADAAESVVTVSPASDDLAPLFAALRVPDPLPQRALAGEPEEGVPPTSPHTIDVAAEDRAALELRDQLLVADHQPGAARSQAPIDRGSEPGAGATPVEQRPLDAPTRPSLRRGSIPT